MSDSHGVTTSPPEACSPTICGDLATWCHKYGISEAICDIIVGKICPGDPCTACDIAASRCVFGDTECEQAAMAVCEESAGCDCSYYCGVTANWLPKAERTALCYVHPWTLGKWCSEPDEAMCLQVMSATCAPTACEYLDCIAALDVDPCTVPAKCAGIHECLASL